MAVYEAGNLRLRLSARSSACWDFSGKRLCFPLFGNGSEGCCCGGALSQSRKSAPRWLEDPLCATVVTGSAGKDASSAGSRNDGRPLDVRGGRITGAQSYVGGTHAKPLCFQNGPDIRELRRIRREKVRWRRGSFPNICTHACAHLKRPEPALGMLGKEPYF